MRGLFHGAWVVTGACSMRVESARDGGSTQVGDWPASLKQGFAEFRRRRVFRVVAVYLVVSWLLIQIGDATFEPLGFPAWAMKLLIVMLALGSVLAVALAWTYDIGARGIERTAALPAPPVTPAAPALDASIAILPFADLSEAKDQDCFCDGLAEEILNGLAAIRRDHVAAGHVVSAIRCGMTSRG